MTWLTLLTLGWATIMPDCQISYEPNRGILTGEVRDSPVPWDAPDTWWLMCIVTFPAWWSRTEQANLAVPMSPAASIERVLAEAQRRLTILCATEAIVTHVCRPMDTPTIMFIQEWNAKQAKVILAHRREDVERCHEEALVMHAEWTRRRLMMTEEEIRRHKWDQAVQNKQRAMGYEPRAADRQLTFA